MSELDGRTENSDPASRVAPVALNGAAAGVAFSGSPAAVTAGQSSDVPPVDGAAGKAPKEEAVSAEAAASSTPSEPEHGERVVFDNQARAVYDADRGKWHVTDHAGTPHGYRRTREDAEKLAEALPGQRSEGAPRQGCKPYPATPP